MKVFVVILFSQLFIKNYGLLQNDKRDIIQYVLLDDKNPCTRKCEENVTMTCYYHFVIEGYHTLSKACYSCPYVKDDCFRQDCIPADGQKRSVTVVNRQMPGPSIEVCLGDEVIIDVENHLISESTTMHWHGHHQKFNPYMDGVPYVTQCPITSGSTFRYQFPVKNVGTHFWHSHSGFQRIDGAFGAFIVRIPDNQNPHRKLYDFDLSEHVITLLDWEKETGLEKFLSHHHNDGNNKPTTILVNGFGTYKAFNKDEGDIYYTPIKRFTIKKGYRYRFRVINAGFLNCPIEISIDNHTLTSISGDGSDLKPIEVGSLVIYAGERFDFIVNANQYPTLYWMRFRGLMDCDQRFFSVHQTAILQYYDAGHDEYPESNVTYENSVAEGNGYQLNSLNKGTEANTSLYISLPHVSALAKWDDSLKEEADLKYYVSYDFYEIDNPTFHKYPYYPFKNMTDPNMKLLTPQLNRISMKLLPFPLLSQRYEITEDMICNETTVKKCEENFCECTHIVQVPLNHVVEMILIDKGFAYDANHPFHLHGHSFRVVAMERLGSNVTVAEVLKRDEAGLIKRNLIDAPIKDTVTVPDGGYTIIRFKASNPGYWLFHCHIEFHVEVGMGLVFKVGTDDEMPPVPVDFPRCGSYLRDSKENIDLCTPEGSLQKFLHKLIPSFYTLHCKSSAVRFNNGFYDRLIILLTIYHFFVR